MPLLQDCLITFLDILTGHAALAVYLFAVMDERMIWKKVKKLPPLLLSPIAATAFNIGLYMIIPGTNTLRYAIFSCVVLTMCTVWTMWVWRMGFWSAFSSVCMAGIFQVATSALSQFFYLMFPLESEIISAVVMVIFLFIVFVGLMLLKKMHFGTYFQLLLEDEANLRRTSLLIFALEVVMDIFLVLQSGIQYEYLASYYILTVVLILLIVWLVIHMARLFDDRRMLQTQRDIIAQQQLYEQNLEEIRRETRLFRHDYKNLLAGLSRQAGEGELEELRATLSRLDADFDRRLGKKIQTSTQIGNLLIPEVRSLLLSKLASMGEKGVECRLEVLYPVKAVGMDVWTFVRCLGILVDNAAEAAQETEQPWVEIILLAQDDCVSLRVANSWNGQGNPTRFWEEGWSSKGGGRGLGLSSYQHMVEGCPAAISSTSWADGVFIQELTIGGRQ